MGILSGYRVIDLTIAMAGPLAAMRLGDLGADVVKVEPVSGEWQRHTPAGGAAGHQINASFLSLNRNKRSLAVNLKAGEGRAIVLDLARRSDVFLQNYRPGGGRAAGHGLRVRPRGAPGHRVRVDLRVWGERPVRGRPGQDMLLQAMSGAMFNVGRASDPPAPAGTYAVDAITGYGAFEGALAGLLHRERTGEGQLVTVNMLDSAIAVQAQELSIYTVGGIGQHRGREVHGHAYIRAPYGTFATADGYLALAFPPLAPLGEVLGIGEFAGMDDEVDGHARRDEITALVRARLPERGTAEWLAEFDARGIWAGPVYDYADVLADPQVQHNGSLVSYDHPTEGRVTTPGFPYRFSATPPQVYRGAPLAGEQTREILAELGYDGASVDRLADGGVVAEPAAASEPGERQARGAGRTAEPRAGERPREARATRPGRSRDRPAERADLGSPARLPGAGRAGRRAGTGCVGALAAAAAGGVRVPAAAHPGRRLRPAGRGPSRARRGDPGRRPGLWTRSSGRRNWRPGGQPRWARRTTVTCWAAGHGRCRWTRRPRSRWPGRT